MHALFTLHGPEIGNWVAYESVQLDFSTVLRRNGNRALLYGECLSEWKFHTANCFSVLSVVIDTLQLGSSCSLMACLAMFFLLLVLCTLLAHT